MSRAPYGSLDALKAGVANVLRITADGVEVLDAAKLRETVIDSLIYTVVFGEESLRPVARWLVRAAANALGAVPSSIHELYMAGGRGEYANATAPAINLRGLTFDTAATVFKAARKNDTKIVLFEIARSEMGYTWQRPAEYAACVLAGAIKAGHSGPVFIQGDHFQAVARYYAGDPQGELQKVRDLTKEAIEAGFYNIDIDTSTLVDINLPTLEEQQRINAELTAEMSALIRDLQPAGVTVSIGGEIGEVGHQNSTVEDLHAFMGQYQVEMRRRSETAGRELPGISKISVQTGTSHGGVVLPDGTIAQVNVDFETLGKLSEAARTEYGIGGAVQHGASTLPPEAFDRFAEANAIEVHLATAFQNTLYDHALFPSELRDRIYAHLTAKHSDERKASQTDAQFFYSTRKRGYGPFKRELWDLPQAARLGILGTLEESFSLIMQRLGVGGKAALVDRIVTPVAVTPPAPAELTGA